MIKAVIFDLDGVIIDSEPLHFQAYKKTLEKYNYSLSHEVFTANFQSKGRRVGIESVLGKNANVEAIGKKKDEYFHELLAKKPNIFFEDALEWLSILKREGIRLALATGSRQGRELLNHYGISEIFEVIVTSGDVVNNKPAPDIYLKCLSLLGIEEDEVIVLEDSKTGILSAQAAGLKVYGVRLHEVIDHVEVLKNTDQLMSIIKKDS